MGAVDVDFEVNRGIFGAVLRRGGVYNAGCARLCGGSSFTPSSHPKKTHLANSIEDALLAGDVARVKGNVVVSLDDVKDRDDVATSDEVFDDVSTNETTPTDDEVDVFGLGRHV